MHGKKSLGFRSYHCRNEIAYLKMKLSENGMLNGYFCALRRYLKNCQDSLVQLVALYTGKKWFRNNVRLSSGCGANASA